MSVLSAEDRKNLPASKFAGPGRSFPLTDKTHDREAISGATRSEHADNISHSEAEHIKSEAREELHDGKGGDPPEDHKAAISKMHPEHVHKLVKHAAAGKFGPEAQQMAQQAQQPAQGDNDTDDQAPPQRNVSSIFSGEPQGPAPAAPSRASMFSGRGGF